MNLDGIRDRCRIGPSGCWLWEGAVNSAGYPGQLHREVYEMVVGPIPEGLQVEHRCNKKTCLNPSHLEPATRSQNNWRDWARRTGQMSSDHLRVSRALHDEVTEKNGEFYADV